MTSIPSRSVSQVAVLCLFAAAFTSQAPGPHSYQSWAGAVNAHTPGARDEAVSRIAPWSLDELDGVQIDLAREPLAERVRITARALVLHADIAILHRESSGYTLPEGSERITLFSDGRAVGQMSGTVHWEFARRLIDRLPAGADRTRIARQFYRAAGAVLQFWGEYPELATHFAAGRRILGDDAVLLLYEGTMHQAFAGSRAQRFFDERRRSEARERPSINTRMPPGAQASPEVVTLPAALPSANSARTEAMRLFRRAITFDASLNEARIRLAHLLGDAGRHDDAAGELARVATAPLPQLLEYYASLLTGREARARGQLDMARSAFERAAALYPDAPAPKYGLSELAMAQRRSATSLEILLAADGGSTTEPNEPWWWIERVHSPSAQDLVVQLRELAPQ